MSLTMALTKGRLEKKTLSLLEKAGYGIQPALNKDRELIIEDEIRPLRYVFVKGPDCITYVEKGAADLGVVGKDVLLENDGDIYELLDLKEGKCSFIVAAPAGKDLFGKEGHIIIGTKYPAVARSYFESRGMDVEIIKIEGSVELSPLIGLTDGIVDIMETGNTLKANGLAVLDTIEELSARLIVNKAAFRTKREEILSVLNHLKLGIEHAQNTGNKA